MGWDWDFWSFCSAVATAVSSAVSAASEAATPSYPSLPASVRGKERVGERREGVAPYISDEGGGPFHKGGRVWVKEAGPDVEGRGSQKEGEEGVDAALSQEAGGGEGEARGREEELGWQAGGGGRWARRGRLGKRR